MERYQQITNEQVPRWPVEHYNGLTAELGGTEALIAKSISKSLNVQPEISHSADAYMLMIRKQDTFNNQINKRVDI